MSAVDVSGVAELPILTELLREVSRATRPHDVPAAFGRHFWKVRPYDYLLSVSVRGLAKGEYKITRRIVPASKQPPGAPDPWRDWETIPSHTGGFVGRVLGRPEPQLFQHLDLRGDEVLGDELGEMGSCIASPVFDHGEPLNWTFTFRRDPEGFTKAGLAEHVLITNMVGATTRTLLHASRVDELNAALTRQLEEVARVQQSLLPRRVPSVPGLLIATSYLTSDESGGDYYDFFRLADGRLGVLIADVAGHGAAAATVMAMLHAILHGYEGPDFSPVAVMRYANRRLHAASLEGSFVTAFFATVDPATGEVRFSRAGHNPPRHKHGPNGHVTPLDGGGGLPLGLAPDFDGQEDSVRMEREDTLILYTDGITEAFGPNREMFGVERLDAALERCSGHPECVVESVHTALYEHTRARTRDDDQTLVALRYLGRE